MIERYIQAVNTEVPGNEEPAATRDRLKGRFAAGAARRMTQLGMMTGSVLATLEPAVDDAVIYVSEYGESRALEAYLESFPTASPTLFQTSIHPSGVQQGLIGRQRSITELFPFAGAGCSLGHALLAALLNPAGRVLLCGGDERGTWLRERGVASETSFAYAVALAKSGDDASIGRIQVEAVEGPPGHLDVEEWLNALRERRGLDSVLLPGLKLRLLWKTS